MAADFYLRKTGQNGMDKKPWDGLYWKHGGPKPTGKEERKMKKLTALFLIALLLVSFTGCGGSGDTQADDPNLGVYTAIRAGNGPIEFNVADLYETGFVVELKAKGKCEITVDGEKGRGTWTLDGTDFTLKEGDSEYQGTISDGILRLEDVDGEGTYFIFTKDGVELSAPSVDETVDMSAWEGDWYGWWIMENCTGTYKEEDWEGCWWDACARVENVMNGLAYVTIWDPDYSTEDPASEFRMTVAADGSTESMDGYFTNMSLEPGQVSVYFSNVHENVLYVEGKYQTDKGGYDYHFMLRPWGQLWDDINADDVPPHYESWYLPLLESGAAQAPDTIDIE